MSLWDGCWGFYLAVAFLPWLTHQQLQPRVYCNLCTLWKLSESVSNLCLYFRVQLSDASQQVQTVSVWVNSDQVTEQSSRCKLSVERKNSCVFNYWTATRVLLSVLWDTTDISICSKPLWSNACFHLKQWDLQQWHRSLFPLDPIKY